MAPGRGRLPAGMALTIARLALGAGQGSSDLRFAASWIAFISLRNDDQGGAGPLSPAAQARFLKRQLSLPVSMISQWCVNRSRRAVVILASPNTLGHSPKTRLVVTISEVRS